MSLFQYRPGRSVLHRAPALLKVALLLGLSVAVFAAPAGVTGAAVPLLVLLGCGCGLSLRDIVKDARLGVWYGAFLYATAVASLWWGAPGRVFTAGLLVPPPHVLQVALRLVVMLLLSSLLFRTTSTVALKGAIGNVCPPLAIPMALFLGFIPALFEEWGRLERGWRARGGGKGVRKWFVLLPALLSLAFYQADLKARALQARGG
jgi:biotin transport system permease protein/energy-coupling factor transport system permease protein